MTASATIDTISYLNTNTDLSSTKSNSSDASNFNDIFENANKTYTNDETPAKKPEVTNDNSKTTPQSDKKAEVKTDNDVKSETENTSAEVKDAKSSDDTTEAKTTDATKTTEDTEKAIVSDTNKATTDEDVKTSEDLKSKLEEIAKVLKEKGLKGLEDIPNLKDIIEQMNQSNIKLSDIAKALTNSQSEQTPSTDSANSNLLQGAQGILAALQQATNNPTITVSELAQNNAQQLAQVAQTMKDSISNQTNNLNKNNAQTQVLDSNAATKSTLAQQATATTIDTNIQTPVIQVNTEVIASDATVNKAQDTDTTQNSKDITAKSISQDVLDKTNARIVSIETSNTNSNNTTNNNLLKQQSAAEQAVKLSLESNSKSSNVDSALNTNLTGLTDATPQADFTKTLNSVQAQAPKDLSKSDVMSQIYNKFDNLQETGSTKITIVLKPENLGKINLELMNGKDGLTAKLTTENSQVKELLDKNLNSLRETLSSQGVNVDNVSVKLNEVQKQTSNDTFSFEGQTNQEGQQNSNNTQNSNKNEFSLGEDSEITDETADTETNSNTEKSVSIGSGAGKVDYKV